MAAVKVDRPVRLNMERHIDMSVTGHRHPFKIDYNVGFTSAGRFSVLDIRLWSNGGCSFDLSVNVMTRAMLHIDNTYQFHNVQVRGQVCKTHLPSNTGFSLRYNETYRLFTVVFLFQHFAVSVDHRLSLLVKQL